LTFHAARKRGKLRDTMVRIIAAHHCSGRKLLAISFTVLPERLWQNSGFWLIFQRVSEALAEVLRKWPAQAENHCQIMAPAENGALAMANW
jgi:hypothetical protein